MFSFNQSYLPSLYSSFSHNYNPLSALSALHVGPLINQQSDLVAYVPRYPNILAYQDVNQDRNLIDRTIVHFYDKTVDNWLKYFYLDLYKLINVSGGKASLIKSINEYENNTKGDNHDNAVKYEFLLKTYFNKKDIGDLMNKYRKVNNLNWWDLKKHSDELRDYMYRKIKQYIRKEIVDKT